MKPSRRQLQYTFLALFVVMVVWVYTRPDWEEIEAIPAGYHGRWLNVSHRDDDGADSIAIGPHSFVYRQSNGFVRETDDLLISGRKDTAGFQAGTRDDRGWAFEVRSEGTDLISVHEIRRLAPARDGGTEHQHYPRGFFARQRITHLY